MFLWYVVFWLYTFCIDTRFEIAGLFIATVVVLAIMGGNKSVVWQICSFQLGVITALYGSKIIEWINPRRKWGGLFLIAIALIAVALKKTEYVETHELGMVDTFLQIILTQAVGVLCIIYADFVQKIKASKLLIICGDVSYELYLAHVIMLNWLKEKPIVSVLIEYIIISVFVCIVLVAIRKLIMEGVLKNVWGNKQKG